jgi:hypothetical protein
MNFLIKAKELISSKIGCNHPIEPNLTTGFLNLLRELTSGDENNFLNQNLKNALCNMWKRKKTNTYIIASLKETLSAQKIMKTHH